MIYLCRDIYSFDLKQALAQVNDQRRIKALNYRQERDQRLCLAPYMMLQRALRQDFDIDDPLPEVIYTDGGRPLLKDHPAIHISISHCSEAAAIAIDKCPVGIDIETLDHYSLEVATTVMSETEMRQIQASPHPAACFTRLWTMKESLFKLTGDDHGGDISHMLEHMPNVVFDSKDYPGYILTTCSYSQDADTTI